MSTQHTPGPWLADLEVYPVVVRSQSETWPLVDEIGNEEGRAGAFVCNTGDNKANARLIAAAPSLLGALEFMLEMVPEPPDRNCSCHISPPCNDCVENSGWREAFEFASAAIAKATGGAK